MHLPRFRIRTLMIAVAAIAIGLAAVHTAADPWVTIFFNLVVATLVFGTYQAKSSHGDKGIAWTGFALFGWAYLTLGLLGPVAASAVHSDVDFSPLFLAQIYEWIVAMLEPAQTPAKVERRGTLFLVVHSVISLWLAFCGALVFGGIAARRSRRSASPALHQGTDGVLPCPSPG